MAGLLEFMLSNAIVATLLAILAFGLSRLYRRAVFVHGLWLIVLLKLVTPPLVQVPLPWFDSHEAEPSRAADANFSVALADLDSPAQSVEPVSLPPDRAGVPADVAPVLDTAEAPAATWVQGSWYVPIVAVWSAGSACMLAWIAWSALRFRRVLRFARLADPRIQEMVKKLALELNRTRPPQVWLVPGRVSPMLWGLGARPRLILPAELLDRLAREQLRTILLHELAHWRRRDHWVRLVELAAMVLYWWHPAAWWVRAELRDAEEQCCDAWVIAILEGSDRTYALALLETVAFFSGARLSLPISASGIGHVSHLRRRLTMIMSGQNRRSLTWAGCTGLAAFGLFLLPLVPVRAQQPEKKVEKDAIVLQGDGGIRIVLEGDTPNEEAMELLKRALKLLDEKNRAKAAPGDKQGNPEEIKKMREQVEALTKAAVDQRRALEATEAQLHNARARLAALQGEAGPGKGQLLQLELHVQPDAGLKVAPGVEHKARVLVVPQPGAPQDLQFQLQGLNFDVAPVAPGKKETRNQPDELKKRLDLLLRQAEELRREIERNRKPEEPRAK